ncbi:MAG: RodZ domain-containing protein [Pseudomonadota bacterium]
MNDLGSVFAEVSESAEATKTLKTVMSAGAQLARHRQTLGLSVEDVAAQLKLAPRQILALEADNHEVLPGSAVVRGFIRAYAKVLKLDPDPLMAQLTAERAGTKESVQLPRELSAPFMETRLPLMNRGNPSTKSRFGIFFLVVLFAGVLAHLMGWVPPSIAALMSQTFNAAVPSTSDSSMSIQVPLPHQNASNAVHGSADNADTILNVVPVVSAVSKSMSVTSVESVAKISNPVFNNALELKMRSDSWIEIKRNDGAVMIARLMRAGAAETFDISKPVQLTVGNPTGVDATFRGSHLELKPGAGGSTARLFLK